ncbi:MAG TPA: hypothetical protein VFC31_09600 [Candidatus Limnocylindria bacterium]|nr:hypothetical protein [Candidatus Limnocylindria bacterium]
MSLLDRVLGRRDRARERDLQRAAAAVDRELAANLELATMFDQTHQAVVFENGEFARYRAVLEVEVPDALVELADVYARIPTTEDAMERRGPAASVRPEDRALIESWEGDARAAQRTLRAAVAAKPPSLLAALVARLRGGRRTRR